MSDEQNNVWYVPHPLHQFREDAKALARRAGLRIIDANVVPEDQRVNAAEKPPKLTKIKAEAEATNENLG